MKSVITFLLALFGFCGPGWTQLVIQPGAQVKAANGVLLVFDNIDVANQDPLSDLSSAIALFKGNANGQVSGNGNWLIKKIILDKPAAQLNLATPVQVTEGLQLLNGLLDLNGQVLTLSPGAALEGEKETARIVGPVGGSVQTSLSLNNPASVNPGNLGAVISSSQNLGMVTVKRSHASVAGEPRVQRLYEIVPANNTALNATLRLHYLDAERNTLSETALQLYSRNNAEPWSLLGSSGRDGGANYVETSGLSSLQHYSLAAGGTPLPLVWGPVSATCNQNRIEVAWTTLLESNVQQFVVQRSNGANQWTDMATVPATGNSGTPRSYTYLDAGAGSGKRFYRIRSEDIDGQITYSGVAAAQACSKKIKLSLAPVPAQTETVLTIGAASEGGLASITLIGADGRVVRQKSLKLSGIQTTVPLSLQGLANGTYYVEVLLPDGTREVLPLAKQ